MPNDAIIDPRKLSITIWCYPGRNRKYWIVYTDTAEDTIIHYEAIESSKARALLALGVSLTRTDATGPT